MAAASINELPPSLTKALDSLHVLSEVESVHYSAPSSMIPGSTDTYLFILKGSGISDFELIRTTTCVAVESPSLWECSQQKRWRISRPYEVFVEGNGGIQDWISKDPAKALSPYVALLKSIPNQFSRDRFDAPPSVIYIDKDGAQLIYSRYGSGCSTTYDIKSAWSEDGFVMHLDTLNETAFCI